MNELKDADAVAGTLGHAVPDDAGAARLAWARMRDLVLERDRRTMVAQTLGMSFQRVKVLRQLAGGEIAHHELAAELQMDKPYTTVIIRDLLDRGLVETRPNPRDGRSKLVSLTPAGRVLTDRATQMLTEPPPDLAALSSADLAELNRILVLVAAE